MDTCGVYECPHTISAAQLRGLPAQRLRVNLDTALDLWTAHVVNMVWSAARDENRHDLQVPVTLREANKLLNAHSEEHSNVGATATLWGKFLSAACHLRRLRHPELHDTPLLEEDMDEVLQQLKAKLQQRLPDVKVKARKERPLLMVSADAWPPEAVTVRTLALSWGAQ